MNWVFFVSRRFSKVDRKGSSAVTGTLASLGICFGVMTLITVISVMNGFQRSFIDAILEVSSYHVRILNAKNSDFSEIQRVCAEDSSILTVSPFYEAQSLVTGRSGKETSAIVRSVPVDLYNTDAGFAKELRILGGNFDLSSPDTVVIGSEFARKLGARLGSEINLYALSGGNDVDLFSSDRVFTVTGIFHTGYAEINASYAFVSLESGKKYFGKDAQLVYGIKVQDSDRTGRTISRLKEKFPEFEVQSWNDYNRSFFGALRVEKNMLMLLVFLIFVVVGINIFNGMRRMVYERREEISVLCAFGGRPSHIQAIFIMQGFLTGLAGALPGLVLGLLLSVKMGSIFMAISKITYYLNLFFTMLFSPQNADYLRENSMFMVYANIPPRIFVSEVLVITIFGIFSSLLASLTASRGVLKLTVAEVMRDE
ncbi:MAG: ABC transporter permease [Treponema sp.]|nr:ABC transporter permease [Candidatus Treponema equifaecale]